MAEQRSKEIQAASELIMLEMLNDIALTTTIAAHREIKRGRVVCGTCGKRCRSTDPLPIYPTPTSKTTANSRAPSPMPPASQESIAGPSSQGQGNSATTSAAITSAPMLQVPSSTSIGGRGSSPAPGRSGTPGPGSGAASGNGPVQGVRSGGYTVGPEKGTGGSTGIGSGSGRPDAQGNVFFDCLTASNRYAPHLSSCLGLSGSTRRGASRSTKARTGGLLNGSGGGNGSGSGNGSGRGDAGSERGGSPYVARTPSEAGDSDDGASVGGRKGKKGMGINSNGKRGPSPKKSAAALKKARMNASGTATPTTKPSAPSKLSQPPTNATSSHGHSLARAGSVAASAHSADSVSATGANKGRARSPSETPSFGSSSQQLHKGQAQVQGSKARKTIPGLTGTGTGTVPPPKSLVAYDDSDDEWTI